MAAPFPNSAQTVLAVLVPTTITSINAAGELIVQTTDVLSAVIASTTVTRLALDANSSPYTASDVKPIIIATSTDVAGRPRVYTSIGDYAPKPGQVRTATDA